MHPAGWDQDVHGGCTDAALTARRCKRAPVCALRDYQWATNDVRPGDAGGGGPGAVWRAWTAVGVMLRSISPPLPVYFMPALQRASIPDLPRPVRQRGVFLF